MRGVEFNLLPQSRVHVLEAKAKRDQLFAKAINISLVLLGLFLILFIYANVIQKAQISSVNKNIADKSAQIQKLPDINTILIVENQLKTASTLNQQKHITSRIYSYLGRLTPNNASVSNIQIDSTANTIKIDGIADSANTVNAFIDSLKSAKFKLGDSPSKNAFNNVIEQAFTINPKNVTYSLTGNYETDLFSNANTDSNGKSITPVLSVPSTLTGHTSTDPGSLFEQAGGR